MKDFAFLEFYSAEDAAVAYKNSTNPDFRIRGEKISVMYSRNRVDDDYTRVMPYDRRERRRGGRKDKTDGPVENYYNKQRQR